MKTGIDSDFVQETYRRMTDRDLIRIATQEGSGLTPEAIAIVKNEIIQRDLDQNIANGIDAQNKQYTPEEIDGFCNIVSQLSCPSCGSVASPLNATMTGEVMSFIFFTSHHKEVKVGCPDCLDKANNMSLALTALLGWWGIPWGIFKTIQYISLNIKSKRTNHFQGPNNYLRKFALSTIGELETYKHDRAKLQQIIGRDND